MAEPMPQTYKNHTRWVPQYHFVAAPLFLLNLLWSLYRLVTGFGAEAVFGVLLALGLMIVFFSARVFPLKAQDRVIRLEERLRMQGVLPDDLKARIDEFTTAQLIALRFAPDGELPDLARRVLAGELADQKAIKEAIKVWRPDYQRV